MSKELKSLAAAQSRTTDCRLTEYKTSSIMEDGYKLTGYVLCNDVGKRALVESSAVRWLDNEQMWELMHGPEPAPQASDAPADAPAITQEHAQAAWNIAQQNQRGKP